MARATAHPDHQCISSEDIHGTEVYGSDGKNIGEIDHLIIDTHVAPLSISDAAEVGRAKRNHHSARGEMNGFV